MGAPNPAATIAAYEGVGAVATEFWTWRFRVISFFGFGVATLGTVAGSVLRSSELRLLILPGILGLLLCAGILMMDLRTSRILAECYSVGRSLERELNVQGIFTSPAFSTAKPCVSYKNVVLLMGGLGMMASTCALLIGIVEG